MLNNVAQRPLTFPINKIALMKQKILALINIHML